MNSSGEWCAWQEITSNRKNHGGLELLGIVMQAESVEPQSAFMVQIGWAQLCCFSVDKDPCNKCSAFVVYFWHAGEGITLRGEDK